MQGERNTKYYHKIANSHKSKNHIHKLQDSNGIAQADEDSKQSIATQYFQQLFLSDLPPGFFPSHLCPNFAKHVHPEANNNLVRYVSDSEIRNATFSVGVHQAPGVDGFSSCFFRHHWDIIKDELCGAVRSFFASGYMLKNINHTIIALLPKVKNPNSMAQLRPISLCQVLYKIISKILANRLAKLLPHIIGAHQIGFLRERRITYNIIVAHEIMHFLKRKRHDRKLYMALKLDMEKAYDRLEWDYLFEAMSRLGFHNKFTSWIKACVTSVTYSINLNGRRFGYIKPSRGLRQGDPLSPLLFAICSEGLSSIFHYGVANRKLREIKIARSAPSISHLFFADDSFIFLEVNADSLSYLQVLFQQFQLVSGQKINFGKSAVYFSHNTLSDLQVFFSRILGVKSIGCQDKYLGIPSLTPRSKKDMLHFLEDKLRKRLAGWQKSYLSLAGKETLIKSVASSFPTYAMNYFRLPSDLCTKFNCLISRFWWGSKTGTKPIY
ncbi:LINE-1 retrotransposable element ORF2 protein [Linum grandiflorum]